VLRVKGGGGGYNLDSGRETHLQMNFWVCCV
jgi:hypothetical protein